MFNLIHDTHHIIVLFRAAVASIYFIQSSRMLLLIITFCEHHSNDHLLNGSKPFRI